MPTMECFFGFFFWKTKFEQENLSGECFELNVMSANYILSQNDKSQQEVKLEIKLKEKRNKKIKKCWRVLCDQTTS